MNKRTQTYFCDVYKHHINVFYNRVIFALYDFSSNCSKCSNMKNMMNELKQIRKFAKILRIENVCDSVKSKCQKYEFRINTRLYLLLNKECVGLYKKACIDYELHDDLTPKLRTLFTFIGLSPDNKHIFNFKNIKY